jgi:hypothetical protein
MGLASLVGLTRFRADRRGNSPVIGWQRAIVGSDRTIAATLALRPHQLAC